MPQRDPPRAAALASDDAFVNHAAVLRLVLTLDGSDSTAHGEVCAADRFCGGAGILFSPAMLGRLRSRADAVARIAVWKAGRAYELGLCRSIVALRLGKMYGHEEFHSQPPGAYAEARNGPRREPISYHYIDAPHQLGLAKDPARRYACPVPECGPLYALLYEEYVVRRLPNAQQPAVSKGATWAELHPSGAGAARRPAVRGRTTTHAEPRAHPAAEGQGGLGKLLESFLYGTRVALASYHNHT